MKKQDCTASGWVRRSIVLRLASATYRRRTGAVAALAGIAFAALLLGSGSPASGSVFTQAVSNDYANASNWSPASIPGDGNNDPAHIGGGTIAVYSTSTGYTTASRFLIGLSATSTLTMNGSAGTLTFGGDSLSIANYVGVDGGTGQLNVNAGTLSLTNAGGVAGSGGYLLVGANAGASTGSVVVNGGTINVGTYMSLGTIGWTGSDPSTGGASSLRIDSGTVNIGTGTNADTGRGFLYLKGQTGANSGSATVTLNGGTLSLVQFYIGSGTATKTINLNGGIIQALANNASFLNTGATVNVQNGGAIFDTNGYNVTVAASLVNSGTGGLERGAGTLTLSGANSYVGGTTVKAGTVAIGASNVLADSGAVTVNGASAVFDIAGFSDTVGAVLLQNGGSIAGSGGTLTGSSYTVESGSISAKLGGSAALTKNTAGTVTLSGANTYTGNTVVSAGLLTVTGSLTGAAAGTQFRVNGGSLTFDMNTGTSTFYGDGYGSSPQIGVGATGTLTLQSGTLNVLTQTGASPSYAGSLRLGTDYASSNGTIVVNGGTLHVDGRILIAANNAGAIGTLTIAGGEVNLGIPGYYTTSGDPACGVLWFGAGTSTVNLNGGTLAMFGTVNSGPAAGSAFNFNGGTLKAVAANANFLNLGANMQTVVKSGGAIIDDGGFAIGIAKALTHDSGLGVTPDGGLTKKGAGTLTLSGTSNYTGTTTISVGTLALTGGSTNNIPNSATINIASGAFLNVAGLSGSTIVLNSQTLTGNGTLTGSLTFGSGSTIAAGNSPGLLRITNNYTQQTGGTMLAEISGTSPGTGYDQIAVGGTAALAGTVNVSTINGFMPQVGAATFDILTAVGGISNLDVSGITFNYSGTMLPATFFVPSIVSRLDLGAGAEALELTVGVPEPSGLVLAGLGLVGLAMCGRRRRRA